MKLQIQKLAAIPISVLHRAIPRVWEYKINPVRLPKIGAPAGPIKSFVSHETSRPFVEWKKGIKLPAPPLPPQYHDALVLRESFMKLKSEQQFLEFLNLVGMFTSLSEAEHNSGWTLEELMGCQEMFTQLALRSPDTWGDYAQSLMSPTSKVHRGIVGALASSAVHKIEFYWKGTPPVDWFGAKNLAVIETTNAVAAILTTIELDHLRGMRFGSCARQDCPRFFEIRSKHNQAYCSQPCAHLASIRRMRERKKAALKARASNKKRPRQG